MIEYDGLLCFQGPDAVHSIPPDLPKCGTLWEIVHSTNAGGERRQVEVFASNKCVRRNLSDVKCTCLAGCTVIKYDGSEENIVLTSAELGIVVDDVFTFLHLALKTFVTFRSYCLTKSKNIMESFGVYDPKKVRIYPCSTTFENAFFLTIVNMRHAMLMSCPCPWYVLYILLCIR